MKKDMNWIIGNQALGRRPSLDHVEQLMFHPARQPVVSDTDATLTKLAYDAGIVFIFKTEVEMAEDGDDDKQQASQVLKKVIVE